MKKFVKMLFGKEWDNICINIFYTRLTLFTPIHGVRLTFQAKKSFVPPRSREAPVLRTARPY